MIKHNIRIQIPKNVGMNILSFAISFAVGLWMVPYIVGKVGIAAYGLVPLAMAVSEYIGFIVQSLNNAINRFLVISLQNEDYKEVSRIYSTSLLTILTITLLEVVLMAFLVIHLPEIVDIPPAIVTDAQFLFGFAFIGFSVSLVRGVISTPLFAHNRLDILRAFDVAQVVLRTGGIILLFVIDEPNIRYVGIANFAASVLILFVSIYYSRKIAPKLKIAISFFDLARLKKLSAMGGWVLLTQAGSLLFLRIDLFIANRFLGALSGGALAVVSQLSSLLRSFANMIAGVVAPVVMIYYADNEKGKMITLLKTSYKLMAIIMPTLIGLVCAMAENILLVWLGQEYLYLRNLLIFALVPLVTNMPVYPLFTANVALNRVRVPAIITVASGALNLLLSIFLVTRTSLGLYGIVLAGAIALSLKNTLFLPLYVSGILNIRRLAFAKYQLLGILCFLVSFLIGTAVSRVVAVNSFLMLLLCISLPFCIISVLIVFLFRNKKNAPLSLRSVVLQIFSRHETNHSEGKVKDMH